MKVPYDNYYQSENLFGNPYPEFIDFFTNYKKKGKVLDLGCGQGRDAIPLARLGFTVTAIDNSKVGITQMNQIAIAENLSLTGQVTDIYTFNNFQDFDIILLDSMFHFAKNDQVKETNFIKKIISSINRGALVIFFVQDTGKKIEILNKAIDFEKPQKRLVDKKFSYTFEDQKTNHSSKTDYRMVVIEK